jgi:RNA polymerase sigma-70 factor (ECF subfamily)
MSRVLGINADTPVRNQPSKAAASDDFATFMNAYQDMVFSTAARLIGNDSGAEDISQEVFLRAHQSFALLRVSPTAGGWLKTVATRLSLNHLARYRRRWRFFSELRTHDNDNEESELDFPTPDTAISDIDTDERSRIIDQALQGLPDHQRVPLVLYHFEDMPYIEIASQLRISLAKVKTDIQRGRAALARTLEHLGLTTAGSEH